MTPPDPRPIPEQNAKGELIAECRTLGLPDPSFESETGGPGHAPWFRCTVSIAGRQMGRGEGRSRREAERAASLEALKALTPGESVRPPAVAPARWPIYADVLSQALLVAHERNHDGPLTQVADDAAELYRGLMDRLGHTPENP